MLDIMEVDEWSELADFVVGFSEADIIVVPSSVLDCPLVMKQTDQYGFIDEMLDEEGDCDCCQPTLYHIYQYQL